MTDDERDTLVDELAEAMIMEALRFTLTDKKTPDAKGIATACLPIIERLLAERDIDALLDSVDGIITWTAKWNHPDGGSHCEITLMTDDGHFDGMG